MTTVKTTLSTFLLVFGALFSLRLASGYFAQLNGAKMAAQVYGSDSHDFVLTRKNYAGRNASKSSLGAIPTTMDQRFEKGAAFMAEIALLAIIAREFRKPKDPAT